MSRLSPSQSRRRAFTLVELLVVIGIIAVLLAILIPVVAKVRISAQTANTKNMLTQVSQAINMYKMDQGGYPGPTPNSHWSATPPTGIIANLTATEDLTLALIGGLTVSFTTATPTIAFNKDAVGSGPVSMNKLAPGQKSPYMAYRPEEFSSGTLSTEPGFSWATDSAVPELMDTYADRKPLLYFRANAGVPQGVPETRIIAEAYSTAAPGLAHFTLRGVQGYINPGAEPAEVFHTKKKTPWTEPSIMRIFASNFSTDTVKTAANAGGYVLISAGPDRRYGTDDDIVVGSSGGL